MKRMLQFGGRRLAAGFWLAAILIAGCSPSPRSPVEPPADHHLERLNRSARLAYANGEIEQAADLYRRALDHAVMRADGSAIADARYNLAVCLMTMGKEGQALEMVGQAQAELAREGRAVPPDFQLLQATILYRSGRYAEAWRVTDKIVRQNASPPPLVLQRTYFLRGLIADASGDASRLRLTIENMRPASDDTLEADRTELNGRLAMLEGRWEAAIASLDRAAALRRQDLDYRRMAISLAQSARACEAAGRSGAAARRYLEAGRSAALSGETEDAVNWLDNAVRLSEAADTPAIGREARAHLKRLNAKD